MIIRTIKQLIFLFLIIINCAHSSTKFFVENVGFHMLQRSSLFRSRMLCTHIRPIEHNIFTIDQKKFHSSPAMKFSSQSNQDHNQDHIDDKKTVRVLCIDGGGIRGIIPLHILAQLEQDVGKPTSQMFDVIAGSSTGGVIALGLNLRKKEGGIEPAYKAQDLIPMYVKNCRNIFDLRKGIEEDGEKSSQKKHMAYKQLLEFLTPENRKISLIYLQNIQNILRNLTFWQEYVLNRVLEKISVRSEKLSSILDDFSRILSSSELDMTLKEIQDRRNIFESSHSANGLKKLGAQFDIIEGETTTREKKRLSESLSTVLIPAYDIGKALPFLFNSYEAKRSVNAGNPVHDFSMGDVAMATSAAPTFFPPAQIKDYGTTNDGYTHTFVDGAVVANNPSLYALMTAQRLFPHARNFMVVSLGCGKGPDFTIQEETKLLLEDGGLLGWGPYIIPTLMDASINYTISLLDTATAGLHSPIRVTFDQLTPTGLDKEIADKMDLVSEPHVRKVSGAARGYLQKQKTIDTLKRLTEELKKKRPYATGLEGNILDPFKDLQNE